jgi:hypothetical protein
MSRLWEVVASVLIVVRYVTPSPTQHIYIAY